MIDQDDRQLLDNDERRYYEQSELDKAWLLSGDSDYYEQQALIDLSKEAL